MARSSTLFVASTVLATLSLFVGIACAAQSGSQTPQNHNPPATAHNFEIEDKPKAAVRTPTNQPKGQKTISWKPKAIKTGTSQ
jgi:hypothetical protein